MTASDSTPTGEEGESEITLAILRATVVPDGDALLDGAGPGDNRCPEGAPEECPPVQDARMTATANAAAPARARLVTQPLYVRVAASKARD
jgi:hypothetical protein